MIAIGRRRSRSKTRAWARTPARRALAHSLPWPHPRTDAATTRGGHSQNIMSPAAAKPFDVAILGATGFTGKLACEYLQKYKSPVRWVATGRSATKLAQLAKELGLSEDQTRVVDVKDEASVRAIVKDCAVVANYAGTPFLDKALPVVSACVEAGTSYVDITGEVPLHRASYDCHHERAVETGSCILHGCGYDSVPSDLGAFLAATALRQRYNTGASKLKTFAGNSKGGISGGTLATALMLSGLSGGSTDVKSLPGVAEVGSGGSDPLSPPGRSVAPVGQGGGMPIGYDANLQTWHQPFIMAGVNTPVVRKSASILSYGAACHVEEVQASKSLMAAITGTASLALMALLAIPPLRCVDVLPSCARFRPPSLHIQPLDDGLLTAEVSHVFRLPRLVAQRSALRTQGAAEARGGTVQGAA